MFILYEVVLRYVRMYKIANLQVKEFDSSTISEFS